MVQLNQDIPLTSTEDLAERCAEESSKKSKNRDDSFCFELVRRAFAHEDQHALGHVLHIYKCIWSRFWIRNSEVFETHVSTIDDFKSIAFFKVYDKLKGSRLEDFANLSAFLGYCNRVLMTTWLGYMRSADAKRQKYRGEPDNVDETPSHDNSLAESEKNLAWEAIEKRVAVLLPNVDDRLLFNCWAKQELTYLEISQAFPKLFPTEDAVRAALQRIRRRLYGDTVLHDLLKR
jgi:DNA-directed RNA polymerase specialized sigma24 family protein